MTDKELLEAAAKAAGYTIHGWINDRFIVNFGDGMRGEWEPLTDDGDAFRLMADLMLAVKIYRNCVIAENIDDYTSRSNVGGGKRNEATRRAIVNVAAEIGRDME